MIHARKFTNSAKAYPFTFDQQAYKESSVLRAIKNTGMTSSTTPRRHAQTRNNTIGCDLKVASFIKQWLHTMFHDWCFRTPECSPNYGLSVHSLYLRSLSGAYQTPKCIIL